MAQLVVREGKNPGFSLKLPEGGKVTLGRRSSNEFQVLDEKASRHHAEVYWQGGTWFVRDLKSRNGVEINGQKLENEVEIDYGDKFSIGDTVIEIVDDAAFEPIEFEIPGYELLEKIGEGAMGTVYKARQLSMDRIVALKVLNEKFTNDNSFIERFIREARSAGRLNHPNVIHVHDVNKAGGRHFFSMEFVDGVTVRKMLKKGAIEVDTTVDIVLQAAKALEFAHENQIIHRDVKPENLMVSSDNVVKIADLGIAKSFDEGKSAGAKRVFGTPHYMAPEQALGKSIDARVDIYSLGSTFYHMLTGETPFKGENATEVLKAHIQDSLPPIQELNPRVPDSVVFIVERMMAKSPDKRYESMSALIEDLDKVIVDRGTEIQPLEPGESSIRQAAVPSKALERRKAEKGEAEPRKEKKERKERPGLPLAAKIGLLVGILALAATVFVVVIALVGRPSGDGDGDGGGDGGQPGPGPGSPTAPGDQSAAGLLRQAADLEANGDLDGALQLYERIARDFPDTPEADKAAERAIEVLSARAAQAAEKAAAAVKSAEEYARASPEDLQGQRDRWVAIKDAYEGTPQCDVADAKIAEMDKKLAGQVADKALQAYDQARRLSDDRLFRRQFDAALQPLADFVVRYPDSAKTPEAKNKIAAIKDRVKKLYEQAESDAKGLAARNEFGRGMAVLQKFVQDAGSQEYRSKANKLRGDLNKKAGEKFAELARDPNAKATAFEYDDAANGFRRLENVFNGTQWAKLAEGRRKSVEAQKALHADIIKRINAAGGRKDYKELPWRLKSFPRQRFFVTEASESQITLMGGRNVGSLTVAQPKRWSSLEAKQLYKIILLYYPKPTTKEHLWLAYFCEDRDLTDEADVHFEKAGQ